MIERKYNYNAIGFICVATIVITVLTQVPSLSSVFRPIMYVMWIVALMAGVVSNHFRIPLNSYLKQYIITLGILGLECLLLVASHSSSYALQIIPLPLLCYIVGLLIAQKTNEKIQRKSLYGFFIVSVLMFTYIFVTYIGNLRTWYNANYYIYEQKNSAAQIIGCTIIMAAFLIHPTKNWLNISKNIAIALLFVIIVAMQCRTALVGLIITAIAYYLIISHGRKKVALTIGVIVALIIVANSETLSNYVFKAFVFNERQLKNLDYFTSGRVTYFSNAWELFLQHPLVGTGHHRVDDFYLCMLSDVGLIGSIPIFILWLTRIIKNVSAFFREKSPFTACVLCMTVFYFCESLFEAYPPFGPGVCAFMFWIVCAFLDSDVIRKADAEKIYGN